VIQYRAFLTLQWVMERLPRGLAYALAIVVARLAFVFARGARSALADNLRAARPEATAAEIRTLTYRNFRYHSKAYADLMRLPTASVEDLRPLMDTQGLEHLEAALARRRGVLVVSAHMGSWEVAAAIWSATIAPVSLFAEVLEPKEMYAWYRQTRARLGISVLPLNQAGLRQVLRALNNNEMVVTAVDRDFTGTGVETTMFGRPVRIPHGPAAIAVRRGTPLLPVCVLRQRDDRYLAIGWPPIFAKDSGDAEADVRWVVERLVAHLEEIIRAHPEQWHMPHRLWPAQAQARSGTLEL